MFLAMAESGVMGEKAQVYAVETLLRQRSNNPRKKEGTKALFLYTKL